MKRCFPTGRQPFEAAKTASGGAGEARMSAATAEILSTDVTHRQDVPSYTNFPLHGSKPANFGKTLLIQVKARRGSEIG